MKLPKYLTTVTPFSKTLAIILFVFLPVYGFIFGMEYNQIQIQSQTPVPSIQTVLLPTSIPTPTPTNTIKPKITITPTNNLTWDECVKMPKSRVLQTYPSVCVTSDGRRVTESVKKSSWNDCSKNPNNKIVKTNPTTCIYPDGTKVTAPPNNPNL
jgi:hypothetical protein